MMKMLLATTLLIAMLPTAASAQWDVTRRAYTFLDNRLVIAVHADAPGELQVVRGDRGRVEVAARSIDGFAGFGFGGDITRQLRLTAVGSSGVQYLVIVPEHVTVRVQLPGGGSATVAPRSAVATYHWGDDHAAPHDVPAAIAPTTASGLYVVHSGARAPGIIDIPGLGSIRSLALRVQGSDFRVAASRPLDFVAGPGHTGAMQLRIDGAPIDLVIYVPRSTAGVLIRSDGQRVARVSGGRPQSFCGGSVLQTPSDQQEWLTVFPRAGRLNCR